MKRIVLIVIVVFLVCGGNAFGTSFFWIQVTSENRESGFDLHTELTLNSPNAPTVEYSWDGNNFHPMAFKTMWGTEYYTDNITDRSGISPPANFNSKTFTYRVIDGLDNIQANGTIHTIRQIALSSNVTILKAGVNPTISWYNPDTNIDSYRIRILDESSDLLWEKSLPYVSNAEYTIRDFSFTAGKQYYIRIEGRDVNSLSDIQGDPVSLFFNNLNRSVVILPYYFTSNSLTWSLENVVFNDGGVATGTFIFDASSKSVLNWSISVSGGDEGVFPVFIYNPTTAPEAAVFDADSGLSIQFFIDGSAPGGTPESRTLVLTTEEPLTDEGGTVLLRTTGISWNSRECYNCNPWRPVTTGSVSAVTDSTSNVPVLQLLLFDGGN